MKNILILDTGKEWGGGTNSLIELLKRRDADKYRFSALFYYNYRKGDSSDVKQEIENLGIDFLLHSPEKQATVAKICKEVIRTVFFFNKKLRKYYIFLIDYQFRIKKNSEYISKILKDYNIDLLYMNNQPSSNLEGIIASHFCSVPSLQHSRIETTLNKFEIKIVNNFLNKMICVSNGVKDEFVRQGVDSSKCIVVCNGIDARVKAAVSPDEIRHKLGVQKDDIVIGTVGSLIKRKHVFDIIEAFFIIFEKKRLKIKCVIVGEGDEKNRLIEKVRERNLQNNVIFTGFQADAISYINAMDIFIMASEKEGLPRVILEAMLMAKPVVASLITGPSELVDNNETGFLVEKGCVDLFANGIMKLVDSQTLREQMGQKALSRVQEKFSIEQYVNGVNAVLKEVLDQ